MVSSPSSAVSPLAWSVFRRLAVVGAACSVLWLAVGWALGWWE